MEIFKISLPKSHRDYYAWLEGHAFKDLKKDSSGNAAGTVSGQEKNQFCLFIFF